MTLSGAPEPSPTDVLLSAVRDLTEATVTLTKELTVAKSVATRTRMLTLFMALVFVCVGYGGYSLIAGNAADSKQTCENGNESRANSLLLWNTVLGYVNPGNANPQIQKLQAWIAILYQPHDCSDLSRVYKIPPPPTLTPAG